MRHRILLKFITCLLVISCLSKKNGNKENQDTHIKQSRIKSNKKKNSGNIKKSHKKSQDSQLGSINIKSDEQKVNNNESSTKIVVNKNIDAGNLTHNVIHNFIHIFHRVEHAEKILAKEVNKIAKETDIIIEAVEKVSKKITKVVDNFRNVLDKFTKFAETTSLALAIDSCFATFELPITLEEFDATVDGIDEALHLFNKLLVATDLTLKLIIKATNSHTSNPTSAPINGARIKNLQSKIKIGKEVLIKRKEPKKIRQKKFIEQQAKIKELNGSILKIKKTEAPPLHFFRLISKRENILVETSKIIKNANDKNSTKEFLKSINEGLVKNINLYKKILGVFNNEKKNHEKSNELFIVTCTLLPSNKDVHKITKEEINKGIVDKNIINLEKIDKVRKNIKSCGFLENSKHVQETLINIIKDEFSDLFSTHPRGKFITYLEDKEYKNLSKFIKEEINKCDQEIKKKIDYIMMREIIQQLFKKDNEPLEEAEINKACKKSNTFNLNMSHLFNDENNLNNTINKILKTSSLFSSDEISTSLQCLNSKKYENLLDLANEKISKCHEKETKRQHFSLVEKIVKKLVETQDKDTQEIQDYIERNKELYKDYKDITKKLTKKLDLYKNKLEPHLKNQNSYVDSENIIIKHKIIYNENEAKKLILEESIEVKKEELIKLKQEEENIKECLVEI